MSSFSTGWGSGKKSKSKYYNKKTFKTEMVDGKATVVKSDSKLERKVKDLLNEYKIPYEYQFWYELIPTHVNWEGVTVKRMKLIVDFKIVTPCGITIWVDPKGCPTQEAIIKFKMLSFLESKKKNHKYIIKWLKTEYEAGMYINEIYEKYFKNK